MGTGGWSPCILQGSCPHEGHEENGTLPPESGLVWNSGFARLHSQAYPSHTMGNSPNDHWNGSQTLYMYWMDTVDEEHADHVHSHVVLDYRLHMASQKDPISHHFVVQGLALPWTMSYDMIDLILMTRQ